MLPASRESSFLLTGLSTSDPTVIPRPGGWGYLTLPTMEQPPALALIPNLSVGGYLGWH